MTITQKFENGLIKANQEFDKWKEKGNNYFNVFDALGVGRKENYHSAFIAYLLDKNSEHYQSEFAKLFLEKLQSENTIPNKVFGNLSVENLQNVATEAVTEKIAQNRRVDILLRFDNFVNIIIENKIYAKDQNSQIKDYITNFAKTPNKTLVIYLHPNEIDPSEVSFGKTSGKWHLDKDGQYCVIRNNGNNIKAYYFQMTYEWIKKWVESCIKWLEKQSQSKIDNGLNKIIFGLTQYVEILEWYITGEWEQNDPVAEFIVENNKNQKMALEIMDNPKHNLHEIVKNSWNSVSERVVENFYNELLQTFEKSVKIDKNIWKAYRTDDELGKTGWQMVFYKKIREYLNCDYVIGFGYGKSNFAMPRLAYGYLYEFNTEEEQEKYKKIVDECRNFFKDNRKNGVRKNRGCYYKDIFNEKDTQEYAFVEWIIKQNGNAVENFKALFTEFTQLEPIKEVMKEVEKHIDKNL